MGTVLVKAINLTKVFPIRLGFFPARAKSRETSLHAVDAIDLEIDSGEIMGLVGETGCGKTTTGRLLALLEEPTEGRILFQDIDLTSLSGKKLKNFRRKVQMIFQNPFESLDQRFTVRASIVEPIVVHNIASSRTEKEEAVYESLESVGLRPPEQFIDRYPNELSGGQKQRVSIARALVLKPAFLVADEPVSMLDVSARAGIMDLMLKLRREIGITCLFISHDLAAARYVCDKVTIMYLGKIVESGEFEEILRNPCHPYTKLLLSAIPVADPDCRRQRIEWYEETNYPMNTSRGCGFFSRCQLRKEMCREHQPTMIEVKKNHFVRCDLFDRSNS